MLRFVTGTPTTLGAVASRFLSEFRLRHTGLGFEAA